MSSGAYTTEISRGIIRDDARPELTRSKTARGAAYNRTIGAVELGEMRASH